MAVIKKKCSLVLVSVVGLIKTVREKKRNELEIEEVNIKRCWVNWCTGSRLMKREIKSGNCRRRMSRR